MWLFCDTQTFEDDGWAGGDGMIVKEEMMSRKKFPLWRFISFLKKFRFKVLPSHFSSCCSILIEDMAER